MRCFYTCISQGLYCTVRLETFIIFTDPIKVSITPDTTMLLYMY